jgi:hypothetical protein
VPEILRNGETIKTWNVDAGLIRNFETSLTGVELRIGRYWITSNYVN